MDILTIRVGRCHISFEIARVVNRSEKLDCCSHVGGRDRGVWIDGQLVRAGHGRQAADLCPLV